MLRFTSLVLIKWKMVASLPAWLVDRSCVTLLESVSNPSIRVWAWAILSTHILVLVNGWNTAPSSWATCLDASLSLEVFHYVSLWAVLWSLWAYQSIHLPLTQILAKNFLEQETQQERQPGFGRFLFMSLQFAYTPITNHFSPFPFFGHFSYCAEMTVNLL